VLDVAHYECVTDEAKRVTGGLRRLRDAEPLAGGTRAHDGPTRGWCDDVPL
jgi:hypothetical protein